MYKRVSRERIEERSSIDFLRVFSVAYYYTSIALQKVNTLAEIRRVDVLVLLDDRNEKCDELMPELETPERWPDHVVDDGRVARGRGGGGGARAGLVLVRVLLAVDLDAVLEQETVRRARRRTHALLDDRRGARRVRQLLHLHPEEADRSEQVDDRAQVGQLRRVVRGKRVLRADETKRAQLYDKCYYKRYRSTSIHYTPSNI